MVNLATSKENKKIPCFFKRAGEIVGDEFLLLIEKRGNWIALI